MKSIERIEGYSVGISRSANGYRGEIRDLGIDITRASRPELLRCLKDEIAATLREMLERKRAVTRKRTRLKAPSGSKQPARRKTPAQ